MLKGIADRAARWERFGVELILVCARRTRWSAESSAGGARVIYGPATATDSQLRTIGLEAATGDVVMLLGDPAAADDHWIERLTAAGRIGDAHRDS